jgi:hypothetical protein
MQLLREIKESDKGELKVTVCCVLVKVYVVGKGY